MNEVYTCFSCFFGDVGGGGMMALTSATVAFFLCVYCWEGIVG